ncbi:MAG: Holliday junction resolvase RuvX [Clostridia bacterium]|nr:Holliday junction resolvase RuvX [Clostridia bacterium]
MRILGIDYGDSRIGIAVSDALGWTAQPVTVISEKEKEKQLEGIIKYIAEYNVDGIVMGFPKNMNGTIGERAEKTRAFAQLLEERCGKQVVLWDERLSSSAAHRTLAEGNVSGKKRKGILDKLAAVFILQSYLDLKKGC